MDPFQLAKYLKRKFGQNVDVYQLIEHFNIILLELNTRDFIGGYRYIMRRRLIQVNQNLDENLKRCVLWHELGHALCHRTIDCYYMANNTRLRTNMYEVEAEQFAAEMLLPEYIDDALDGRNAQEIAAYYGVTVNLVETKWGNNRIF